MARDFKRENEWAKTKYTIVKASIDKKLGEELKEKLKNEGITVASWITENTKEYLKK